MMNQNNSHEARIQVARMNASHGEFFFAQFEHPIGARPVFVISNDNDTEDVIVCACTKTNPRGEDGFDIPILIRNKPGSLRTNKISTINRTQLLNPLKYSLDTDQYNEFITKISKALKII